MRVTLVFPPRTSPTYAPLGIASLAASARQAGLDVTVFDANLRLSDTLTRTMPGGADMVSAYRTHSPAFYAEETYLTHRRAMAALRERLDSLADSARRYLETGERSADIASALDLLVEDVLSTDPERIGFSVMFPEQLSFALALAKQIDASQARTRPEIVIGGATMSALNVGEVLRAFPFVDAVVTGEGESAVEHLVRGTPAGRIPGAVTAGNGGAFDAAPVRAPNVALLPAPDYASLDLTAYYNPVPVAALLAGRGCQWRRCRFCAHNASFGTHRLRPAERVVDDIEALQQACGVEHIYFADQYVDPTALVSIADALLRRGLTCHFHIMARTIQAYTPALLEKAAQAGLRWISWGMESGSQKLLDLMGKGTTVEESENVLKHAAAAGISNLLMMIFGAPGTNRQELDNTFNFIDRVYNNVDAMTASAFVLFDQTPFARNPTRYGIEIMGRETLYSVNQMAVHGMRLSFRREGEPGCVPSALAREEVDLWKRRRAWLGPVPFLEHVCCEHYLLHVAARHRNWQDPDMFFDPFAGSTSCPARRAG
jgi:radical SAM superfamily enzyme YgiQ (UPF0313 family)